MGESTGQGTRNKEQRTRNRERPESATSERIPVLCSLFLVPCSTPRSEIPEFNTHPVQPVHSQPELQSCVQLAESVQVRLQLLPPQSTAHTEPLPHVTSQLPPRQSTSQCTPAPQATSQLPPPHSTEHVPAAAQSTVQLPPRQSTSHDVASSHRMSQEPEPHSHAHGAPAAHVHSPPQSAASRSQSRIQAPLNARAASKATVRARNLVARRMLRRSPSGPGSGRGAPE